MKIISGGQTGADQGGLEAAVALGLEYGGAVPKGRLTETGPLDPKYDRMTELPVASYPARTAKNVRESDATLIFTQGRADRGTALTERLARQYRKPFLHIDLSAIDDGAAAGTVARWVSELSPRVLNIAGSRESGSPGLQRRVFNVLTAALRQ